MKFTINVFLKMILILLVSFFGILDFTYAASVDVGNDINLIIPVSNDLNLTATTSGFELCDFIDYMWTEDTGTLFIEMPYEKDMAKIYANDINNNSGIYNIKLTVTCNGGNPDDGGFIEDDYFVLNINGGSSNQSPTDIIISKDNIDENVNTGTLVGNLSTIDLDSSSFIYSLVDVVSYPDNILFKIDGNALKVNFSPDYEQKSSYLIKVETDDGSGGTYQKEFTIRINDLDETIASIDAGNNQTVSNGSRVNLVGTLNGFPSSGCNFKYSWNTEDERIDIINSGSLDEGYFDTSFTGSNIEILFKVKVSSTEITHDSCGKTGIYNDNVFITITDESTSPIIHHHRSHFFRMKDEAKKIFNTSENIKINLYEKNAKNKYFYQLWWNYIGGDGLIKYELQYSIKKDFKNYKKIETKNRYWNFYKGDLEKSEIYFFRLKAVYKNKESPYSNIIYIINKNNLLKDFKIKCINCNKKINYGDVFETVDLLIEKYLNLNCQNCKSNKLKYLYSDIFIYNKKFELQVDKNKYCRQKINYNDIFNYNKGLDFKVDCIGKCNDKIHFNDILK